MNTLKKLWNIKIELENLALIYSAKEDKMINNSQSTNVRVSYTIDI